MNILQKPSKWSMPVGSYSTNGAVPNGDTMISYVLSDGGQGGTYEAVYNGPVSPGDSFATTVLLWEIPAGIYTLDECRVEIVQNGTVLYSVDGNAMPSGGGEITAFPLALIGTGPVTVRMVGSREGGDPTKQMNFLFGVQFANSGAGAGADLLKCDGDALVQFEPGDKLPPEYVNLAAVLLPGKGVRIDDNGDGTITLHADECANSGPGPEM